MSKMTNTKKKMLFFLLMVVLGAIFTIVYLIINGNANQVYNDIVAEYTSSFSSNKSAERNLIFILCFAGIAAYTIFLLFSQRGGRYEKEKLLDNQKKKEYLCVLLSVGTVFLFVHGAINAIIFAAIIVAMVLYVIDKKIILTGICVYFLSIYSYISLYRIYVFSGGNENGNNLTAILFSAIVIVAALVFSDREKALLRVGLAESIVIPFALLVYLSNKYKNGEEIVTIDVTTSTKLFVWLLILVFSGYALITAVKKWKKIDSIEDVIRIGSCVTIMAFNRFDGTGAIMSTDLHHPFENIIGYSQVADLGRIPFNDYIPVSGMYSIIQGAIFDWFGDGGTFANYNVTNNLFYLMVIICVVVLLKKHVDGTYMLLISLVFYMETYNRLVFMLPIMLLLLLPKLIEKKNTWLMVWFMTSLFQGLYYPLYGAATCLAFIPLVIWQIAMYAKSGELKSDIRTVKFWVGWIICLGIAVACIGFLSGTLKHMLAMSGQSILADGISRFGQLIPSWFFGYLGEKHLFIRLTLYYVFTFVIPALFVWVAYAIAAKGGNITVDNKKVRVNNKMTFCMMLSAVIMPIVCYTYTVIRLDINNIYARSTSVLITGVVVIMIFVFNYINKGALRLIIIAFAVSVPMVVNFTGFHATETNEKLQAYYTVPENYIYVEDDPVEKIGRGFINQDTYNAINTMNDRFENRDKEKSYYGDPSNFGYYYLLGIKGDGAMEISATVKSFSAAQEAVDIARDNASIIGVSFEPYYNYYFYHWLMASGEYYWDDDLWNFIPNNGKYSRDEILAQNKNNGIVSGNINIGNTAGSWGLSMESLESIFTEKNVDFSINQETNNAVVNFEQGFDGDEADFIYLEFADMDNNYDYTLYDLAQGDIRQEEYKYLKYLMRKRYNPGMTVQLWWMDENGERHAVACNMSQGKLLLPVGAGAKWLFNEHNYVDIQVFQDDAEIAVPEITNIRFLKLREVQ